MRLYLANGANEVRSEKEDRIKIRYEESEDVREALREHLLHNLRSIARDEIEARIKRYLADLPDSELESEDGSEDEPQEDQTG